MGAGLTRQGFDVELRQGQDGLARAALSHRSGPLHSGRVCDGARAVAGGAAGRVGGAAGSAVIVFLLSLNNQPKPSGHLRGDHLRGGVGVPGHGNQLRIVLDDADHSTAWGIGV